MTDTRIAVDAIDTVAVHTGVVQTLVDVDLAVVSFPSGITFAFVLSNSIDAETVHTRVRVAFVFVDLTPGAVVAVRAETSIAVDQVRANTVVQTWLVDT